MNLDLYNELNIGDIVVNAGFDEYFVVLEKYGGRVKSHGIKLSRKKIPFFKNNIYWIFTRKATPEEVKKFHQHLHKHGYYLNKNLEFVTEF